MVIKTIYCEMKGSIKTETYGLKSHKTPTPINKLK